MGTPTDVPEELVGVGLKGRRDDVVLATKVFFPAGPGANRKGLSRKHIFEGIEASLRRLQTDYLDLYQVHCFDARTLLEETLSALDALVGEGKARNSSNPARGNWPGLLACPLFTATLALIVSSRSIVWCAARLTARFFPFAALKASV